MKKLVLDIVKGFVLILSLGMMCTGCLTFTEDIKIVMDFSPVSLEFDSSAGEKSLTINSNINWSVSSNESWLTVTPGSGKGNGTEAATVTVTVTAGENRNTTERKATVTIAEKSNKGDVIAEKTVHVTQRAAATVLNVSPTALHFIGSGEEKSFDITSSVSWEISVDSSELFLYFNNGPMYAWDWLKVSRKQGETNEVIQVTTDVNPLILIRKQTITVSGPQGVSAQTINVTQDGIDEPPNLQVSPLSLSFSASGSEFADMTISSNTIWTVMCDSSWVIFDTGGSDCGGMLNRSIAVNVVPNSGTTQRTANITVTGKGGAPTRTIRVTQVAGNFLDVAVSAMEFAAVGGDTTFTVSSNVPWTVSKSSSATWLTVLPENGSNNREVKVTAAPNPTTGERSARLTISASGMTSRNIEVTQAAGSNPRSWDLSSTMTATLVDSVFTVTTKLSAEPMPNTGNPPWTSVRDRISTAVIREGVTSVGSSTFVLCVNLKSVTLPGTITYIGQSAFNRCSKLTSITIPGAVNYIGDFAFAYCQGLNTVTVEWSTPFEASRGMFDGITTLSSITLRVPSGSKARYQAASVWKDFGMIVEY